MKKTLVVMLMIAGLAVAGSSGCANMPAATVKSIADIDSNSRANNANFRRVLNGYVPTDEEKRHWTASTIAMDDLTPKVAKWAQDQTKE